MMMVTGSKEFTLFDPAQSQFLYADTPLRQGSLQLRWDRGQTMGDPEFVREARAPFYQDEKIGVHAYSPVDIATEEVLLRAEAVAVTGEGDVQSPPQSQWPLFRHASSTKCTVNKVMWRTVLYCACALCEHVAVCLWLTCVLSCAVRMRCEQGDLLYVPSHWWHEVESFNNQGDINPDEEAGRDGGYSLGINWFFEPYFHRRGFQANLNVFQHNRYYAHLKREAPGAAGADISRGDDGSLTLKERVRGYRMGGAELCDSEFVCFRNAPAVSTASEVGAETASRPGSGRKTGRKKHTNRQQSSRSEL